MDTSKTQYKQKWYWHWITPYIPKLHTVSFETETWFSKKPSAFLIFSRGIFVLRNSYRGLLNRNAQTLGICSLHRFLPFMYQKFSDRSDRFQQIGTAWRRFDQGYGGGVENTVLLKLVHQYYLKYVKILNKHLLYICHRWLLIFLLSVCINILCVKKYFMRW